MKKYPETSSFKYYLGGTLPFDALSYVERYADTELYEKIKKHILCYVFNSRQMGKSSLEVRTRKILEQEGYATVLIDLTIIGAQGVTVEQWYQSMAAIISEELDLNWDLSWWEEQVGTPVYRFTKFINTIVLSQKLSQNILITFDEIDSILSLDFPTDDFFAWIRACYNDPKYERLNIVLFGVATPSQLITDKQRTPFNNAQAVELTGFSLDEAKVLLKGLKGKVKKSPEAVLRRILYWTGGQPFLTQKLCQLMVLESTQKTPRSVDTVVEDEIIKNWESKDNPQHFGTIRDRIVKGRKSNYEIFIILNSYLQFLENSSIEFNKNNFGFIVNELRLSGIIVKNQGSLEHFNNIYPRIFNTQWTQKQLYMLKYRPYEDNLKVWEDSNCKDSSRLLRGKALKDAQKWAKQVQQITKLNSQDKKFLEASLKEENRRIIMQKSVFAMIIVFVLGFIFSWTHKLILSSVKREIAYELMNERQNKNYHINETLLLLEIIKYDFSLKNAQDDLKGILNKFAIPVNLLSHKAKINKIKSSLKGNSLASINEDKIVYIWDDISTNPLPWIIEINEITEIVFSSNGKYIAIRRVDNSISVWDIESRSLIRKTISYSQGIQDIALNNNGDLAILPIGNKVVIVWRNNIPTKQPITFFHNNPIIDMDLSADGTYLATITESDETLRIWALDNNNKPYKEYHSQKLYSVLFSSDQEILYFLASLSKNNYPRLYEIRNTWNWNYKKEFKDLNKESRKVESIEFSPKNQYLLVTEREGKNNPNQLRILKNDSSLYAQVPLENEPFLTTTQFAISSDDRYLTIVTGEESKTIQVWELETGKKIIDFDQENSIKDIAMVTIDGQYYLVTSTGDKTAKVWLVDPDPERLNDLEGEQLVDEACKYVTRNLTEEEWEKYIGKKWKKNLLTRLLFNEKYSKTCPGLSEPEPE